MPVQGRKQTEYSLIDFLLETELETFKNYISSQTVLLHEQETKINDWIDKEVWIEKDEPPPAIAIDMKVNASIFTYNLFYKSTLITLYSFLEAVMKEIARIEGGKLKTQVKPTDLKGQGVLMYKNYLEKVIGIKFKDLNFDWNKIDNVRIIRNHLVHDYLDYSEEKKFKHVEGICKSDKNLEFNRENKEIVIRLDYLLNFCSFIKLFTKELTNNLKMS